LRFLAELLFNDPDDLLHDREELLVFVGIDGEIRAVRGDGEKIGVNFALDAGDGFSPGFHAEQLPLNGCALDLDVDAEVFRRGHCFRRDDDFSGNQTGGTAFENGDALAGIAPRRYEPAVKKNGEARRFPYKAARRGR